MINERYNRIYHAVPVRTFGDTKEIQASEFNIFFTLVKALCSSKSSAVSGL